MTKLSIFTPLEKRSFDNPPKIKKIDRARYFSVTPKIKQLAFNKLRTPINRVGFILQLGYFRASGKFFVAEQFRKRDIQYVCKSLNISQSLLTDRYSKTSRKNHRETIMALSGWALPDGTHDEKLIEQQVAPKKVLESLVEYCWNNKLVIPSYNKLTGYITDHFNHYEEKLLSIIDDKLTEKQQSSISALLKPKDANTPLARPEITLLRNINQSLSPGDIQRNVLAFEKVEKLHLEYQPLTNSLELTDRATEYFALWVQKAKTFQLTNFSKPNKAYLHLFAYLKHQYYLRKDTLIDIFLKSTLATKSQLSKKLQTIEKNEQSERNLAIKTISKSRKDLASFSKQVIEKKTSTFLEGGFDLPLEGA